MYQITTATKKIRALSNRFRAAQGGTGASKTISIIMCLIDTAQRDEKPTLTSIVSESFPHLKRGAMRDFLDIMQTQRYYNDKNWNRSDYTYHFETGSKIEFFSADQPDKVRGPRRDRLFVNEANNVPLETFEQLEIRTNQYIFLDWNPVREFWFYTDVAGRDDVEHIILTFKDNEALPEPIRKSIESRKHRKNWWRVFGEGQLGQAEGLIYTDWKVIDEIPHEARLVRYGLDYGFSNDPTAIIALYYYNGGYIIDEIAYGTGMKNSEIADTLLEVPRALVVADSAEPKSIAEIKERGVNIQPSDKHKVEGKSSVRYGIDLVQEQRISVTKRSLNILHEQRNYMWKVDKMTGKSLNEPEEDFNHCCDAVRYAIESIKKPQDKRTERELAHRRRERSSTILQDAGL